jgi:hypothetical protein
LTTPLVTNAGTLALSATGANIVTASTNGVERLRITSAGLVGIGTSSPSEKLHVNNGAIVAGDDSDVLIGRFSSDFPTVGGGYFKIRTNNIDQATGGISFETLNGGTLAERMRIDGAGNVGIGTSSPAYKLDVNTVGGTQATARLIGNDQANVRLRLENSGSGGRTWEIVGGLPAANNANFSIRDVTGSTTPMTIDSSGNVGIGNTSVTSGIKLDVNGTIRAGTGANQGFEAGWSVGGSLVFVQGYDRTAATFQPVALTGSDLRFLAGSSPTERARIDSSGNFMVGTTTPASSGQVSSISAGGVFAAQGPLSNHTTSKAILEHSNDVSRIRAYGATGGTGVIAFNTGGGGGSPDAERARIDASGNLLVGTTAVPSASIFGTRLSPDLVAQGPNTSSTNSTSSISHWRFFNPNGIVGSINTNASATTYATSSDYRLKEDVQPMVGSVDRLMALKPVNFAWKADGSRVDGFLAHEAQEVVPQAVTGEKDGEEMQAIDHSKLVPLLTAALQEALKRIEALEAQINS